MPYHHAPIHVDALGHLQVRRGPVLVELGPAKQRALFAALAINAGKVVSTAPLISALWGERAPSSARHLVHTYVARLRQMVEPETPRRGRVNVIASAASGYRLLVDPERIDVSRFRRLREQADCHIAAGGRARAFGLLGEAVRLWRDPSLRELSDLLPFSSEVERIRQGWVATALDYVAIGLELGEASLVWPLAERLAAEEPMHERAQAQYLLALEHTGQRAAAIGHFHDVRARLSGELGVEPGPDLTNAYKQLLRASHSRPPLSVPVPAMRPAQSTAAQSTAVQSTAAPWRGPGPGLGELIERGQELAAVSRHLATHRLVTVTGPPGCGKSALALQAAATMRDTFAGGVIVLDCADLGMPALVRQQLVQLVDGDAGADPAATIGGRQLLILLDNVEHLVDAVATQVDEVVRACQQVYVVVTSREPLGLPGETVLRIGPLPVPAAGDLTWPGDYGSVKLFVRRVTQVQPEFRLAPENADLVAMTCRRLDGLPLAVEMAAACLVTDSLDGLVRRLDNPLHEIHPLRRGRPAHHRSLWATLSRSLDCLTDLERWCLLRLSALPVRFHPGDAQAACAAPAVRPVDVSRTLTRLLEKSLLDHGDCHYQMLSLVHRFATELAASASPAAPPPDRPADPGPTRPD